MHVYESYFLYICECITAIAVCTLPMVFRLGMINDFLYYETPFNVLHSLIIFHFLEWFAYNKNSILLTEYNLLPPLKLFISLRIKNIVFCSKF